MSGTNSENLTSCGLSEEKEVDAVLKHLSHPPTVRLYPSLSSASHGDTF